MLLVNDFTQHSTAGGCQDANNIYRLTPRRGAALFPVHPAGSSVTFLLDKHMKSLHGRHCG